MKRQHGGNSAPVLSEEKREAISGQVRMNRYTQEEKRPALKEETTSREVGNGLGLAGLIVKSST